MTRHLRTVTITILLAATATTHADGLLFSYDGDILPGDPGSGFVVANACEPDCSRRLENGRFLLEWGVMGDLVNYSHTISEMNETPPDPLWVEWRFRSNQAKIGGTSTCDARLTFTHFNESDTAYMLQDFVFDFEGGDFAQFTEPSLFHTFRIESIGGVSYNMAVDGVVFNTETASGPDFPISFVQFGGVGDCVAGPERPIPVRNEWDFIRYGTIESGEQIIATDPPEGVLTEQQTAGLTSILVTYDGPNYAYVDDISVNVTSGVAPNVIATRRLDNGSSDVLEVVLDSELSVDVTTTFIFTDPSGDQNVVFTVVRTGACCTPSGTCTETTEPECTTGTFLPGATCEGDADADGVDGTCGDACPLDPDNDIDGDGICGDVDDCPTLNPNDANNDGAPDCQAIPTVSTWGLVVMTLVLIAGGVLLRRRQGA